MRSTARLRRDEVGGFGLAEAVALAASSDTMTALHMKRNLSRFYAVAVQGSLKAGARALGLSSATLSVQMADLERDLATPLLDRSGPTALPTAQGQRLVHLIEGYPHLREDQPTTPTGRR